MKWLTVGVVVAGVFLVTGVGVFSLRWSSPNIPPAGDILGSMADDRIATSTMRLTSSAFENGGRIPAKYTCDGPGISPALSFEGVPAGARSLVLLADDPDVPTSIRPDGMWDHWVVFNISPTVTNVPEGQEPPGVAGSGTGGTNGYHGPCPPDREHRYFFKLYALNDFLSLPEGATKAHVEEAMKGKVIAEAQLMGRYVR